MADTATLIPEEAPGASREPRATPSNDDLLFRTGRRYSPIAVVVATGVMAVPFLWVLTDLWSHSADPFRSRPKRLLLRHPGPRHVPWSFEPFRAQLGNEGFVPRWAYLFLFRNFPVAPQDADPSAHQQVRRGFDSLRPWGWPG